MTESRFKIGDMVIGFDRVSQGRWKPALFQTLDGAVVEIKNGKVFIDTMFGPIPYNENDVEFADVPF